MKRRKGRMNILIMITIIVIIDLLFVGYNSLTKRHKSSAPASNAIVRVVTTNHSSL
ncbi:hypothetical protein [Lentilactobacillus kisonensis]|uniref:Uncharacterized protein n=1 Tax=Lentilactobacillus kisonensis F0435 TaxID=797516 RepID=H1LEK3_9LACO|nr:hypothetical protein [Lentilactobacillus kisonensis]EHO52396.1 hypothetical protein HMPREF9104_01029 [Lentilactobacillus kisonensis F0435]